ncbi:MAG: DUF547 domain-containing protein [Candidatus Thiodiazotropha sp.]
MKQLLLLLGLMFSTGFVQAFDHTHGEWERLLARNVVVSDSGSASRVNYAGMLAERASLNAYLSKLSAVTLAEYRGWKREQQLAFLINAYNAFTVELILTRYPDIESIKDLGSLFRSPWKQRFFTLLRNRFDRTSGTLQLSKIFDWYEEDFTANLAGKASLKGYLSNYVSLLAKDPQTQRRLRTGDYRIEFLDYDWALNDQPTNSLSTVHQELLGTL